MADDTTDGAAVIATRAVQQFPKKNRGISSMTKSESLNIGERYILNLRVQEEQKSDGWLAVFFTGVMTILDGAAPTAYTTYDGGKFMILELIDRTGKHDSLRQDLDPWNGAIEGKYDELVERLRAMSAEEVEQRYFLAGSPELLVL